MFFFKLTVDTRDLNLLTHAFPTRRSSDLDEPKAKHRVHPPIMEIGEAAPKIRPVNHPEPAHAGKRHPEARLPGKALLDAMKGRESSVGRVVPADRRHKRRGYERN